MIIGGFIRDVILGITPRDLDIYHDYKSDIIPNITWMIGSIFQCIYGSLKQLEIKIKTIKSSLDEIVQYAQYFILFTVKSFP